MKYTQLENTYKYETIASAIYDRELEYFHYDFDRINFEYLLKISDDEKFKNNINQRLQTTIEQMNTVEAILNALNAQIDNQEAYLRAVEITTNKRKIKESQSC